MSSNSKMLAEAANNGDVAEVLRLIESKCSPDTADGLFIHLIYRMKQTLCIQSMWKQQQRLLLLFHKRQQHIVVTSTCGKKLSLCLKS